MTADGEREMIRIFGTKEPDAAWERRVCRNAIRSCVAEVYSDRGALPRTMNGKLDYKKLQH